MVNPKTLSTPGVIPDLASSTNTSAVLPVSNLFSESNVSSFFDDADSQSSPSISGQWFTIRLIPDLVAGEMFNVGVAFLDNKTKLHYRIIPNVRPFKCLFGDAGLDNFSFLLNIVKKRLEQNIFDTTSSPHVIYSDPSYASGTTVDEILSSLYHTMVNLQCEDDDMGGVLLDKQPLGTTELRRNIMGRIKRNMHGIYESIYKSEPVYLTDQNTKKGFYLDLPIWNTQGNLLSGTPASFGTIVSAAYKSPVYRGYNVEHGCSQIRNTCEILGREVKAGIMIFRAPPETKGFTESLNSQIDDELDGTLNTLKRMIKDGYPIDITITSDKNVIYDKTLELA